MDQLVVATYMILSLGVVSCKLMFYSFSILFVDMFHLSFWIKDHDSVN